MKAACARFTLLLGATLIAALQLTPAAAEPVRVRYPEGPTHGFVVLTDVADTALAHGELIQWLESRVVASRLVIRFKDGSRYDELVRFSQHPVFRLSSYRLTQRGPVFVEQADISFDRSGRYRVRRIPKPGEAEQRAAGHMEMPDDVSNGMISTLLKNVMPSGSASTHVVTFRPKPLVLELRLTPEGVDRFYIGTASKAATRFLLDAQVRGLKGVVATLAGKQPEPRRMWIVQGRAPSLVRFQGPLYEDGPTWRVGPTAPRWKR